jgi:hypothetical protein
VRRGKFSFTLGADGSSLAALGADVYDHDDVGAWRVESILQTF